MGIGFEEMERWVLDSKRWSDGYWNRSETMGTGSLIRWYKILFQCSNPKSSIINSGLMDSENCTGLLY
ncbi:hypothetical protein RchiOBHm_Chr3g0476011 [Rosa chinensis]|uniref:Uncharacterized protein n=1 Tax=Rosa chinensis TaxID=74649 RepID=A0A2P6RCK0_ROSCH|nr:hypothetical protein RchiOBHm_Chr7g0218821 [Rosa chinensis]PRQ44146.1 hypothetical protein RchiOBHm_Chr3g0476011 [Rosa chinensis]